MWVESHRCIPCVGLLLLKIIVRSSLRHVAVICSLSLIFLIFKSVFIDLREWNIDLLVHFMHSLIHSCMCSDWVLTNSATQPGIICLFSLLYNILLYPKVFIHFVDDIWIGPSMQQLQIVYYQDRCWFLLGVYLDGKLLCGRVDMGFVCQFVKTRPAFLNTVGTQLLLPSPRRAAPRGSPVPGLHLPALPVCLALPCLPPVRDWELLEDSVFSSFSSTFRHRAPNIGILHKYLIF